MDQRPKKDPRRQLGLFIPRILGKNLEAYCLSNNLTQTEVLNEALKGYLSAKGLNPEEEPKITISY